MCQSSKQFKGSMGMGSQIGPQKGDHSWNNAC